MGTHLDEFNIISIEFLRRGMSINEILKTNFEVATTDSYKQVKRQLNSDHFLFCDHSLCALFTLKLSKMLEENHPQSLSLIVSGNAGPGLKKYTGMAFLNSGDFIRELKKLRGLPDELPERFTRTL